LVFAKDGRLFALEHATPCCVNEADELLDLNDRQPERMVAPPLARRW
jgi:hypothetical protein